MAFPNPFNPRAMIGSGGGTLTGTLRNTAQPAFLAYNSVTDSNATGNATVATVDFDTEIFDQGADFTGDTFTAPVTGRYLLVANVIYEGTTGAADLAQLDIVTSNRTYRSRFDNGDGMPSKMALTLSIVADLDANDTVTVTLQINGEVSDVADIVGGTRLDTSFSGCLLA